MTQSLLENGDKTKEKVIICHENVFMWDSFANHNDSPGDFLQTVSPEVFDLMQNERALQDPGLLEFVGLDAGHEVRRLGAEGPHQGRDRDEDLRAHGGRPLQGGATWVACNQGHLVRRRASLLPILSVASEL